MMLAGGAVAQQPVAEAVELKMKYVPGSSLQQDMTMNMDMTMNLQGQKMPMKMSMFMGMKMDVAKDEKGSKVDMKYTRIKMTSNMMGQNMEFDSDKEGGNPQLAAAMAPLMKAKMNTIFKDGKFLEMNGFDNLAPGVDNKALLNQMQQQLEMMPNRPVRVGEKWEKKINVPVAGQKPMEMTAKMTLKSVDMVNGRAIASIGIVGSIDAVIEQQGMKMSMKSKKFEGTMKFDVVDGYSPETSVDMVMVMTPMGDAAAMMGATDISAKTTVKTTKLK